MILTRQNHTTTPNLPLDKYPLFYITNQNMGANLSKHLRRNFQNVFDQPDSDYSDDGIDFDFCLLSRLGVPIYTVPSDSEDDFSFDNMLS